MILTVAWSMADEIVLNNVKAGYYYGGYTYSQY